jgi:hypothetical protein
VQLVFPQLTDRTIEPLCGGTASGQFAFRILLFVLRWLLFQGLS